MLADSGEPSEEARRFDPPVTRVAWRTTESAPFGEVLATLRAQLGVDAVERLLWHRGLQLDGIPVGRETAPELLPPQTRIVAWALAREPEPIEIGLEHVLCDEAGVVAVAKPAWLPVQGTRASQRFSLEAALRSLLGCAELRAANRLDRQTSGVALFARDAATASFLGRALSARRIARTYLAVVSPPPPASFEVSGAMGRVPDPRRFRFGMMPEGSPGTRPSHTRFERLAVCGTLALVEAKPSTGRTHQIRVHLADAGSPVVGDALYGGMPAGAGRCLLHALRAELELPPPVSEKRVLIAGLPADFARLGFPSPL